MSDKKKAYLVFAKPRAVFFGYCTEQDLASDENSVTLTDAQMCIYWDAKCKGVLGLAKTGPIGGSRVTPAIKSLTIKEQIEGYAECSEEAIKQWKKEPF